MLMCGRDAKKLDTQTVEGTIEPKYSTNGYVLIFFSLVWGCFLVTGEKSEVQLA